VDEATMGRLVTVAVVLGVAVAIWFVGKLIRSRLPEQWRELVGQLIPVLVLAVVVVGLLVVIDPDQADTLLQSVISSVPKVMVALIVIIIARALGRIVGLFAETALRGVSSALAGRARLLSSSVIFGIGIVIAMQQIGISTDIILVLVAALAFGTAGTVALGVGLGSVPVARQVAAGRHVQNRYEPGDRVRVGDVEGRIVEIGLAKTRIEIADGRSIDVPNLDILSVTVSVDT
jgi:small-conductance mechanosensitive channel